MRKIRSIMGMPVTVEVVGKEITAAMLEPAFAYFTYVDETFSTYKEGSEISRINQGALKPEQYSADMQTILRLAEETKAATEGYFDIGQPPHCDPSGIVKGWAIHQVAQQLLDRGFANLYVEAGGDIEVHGQNSEGQAWRLGIRNPFNLQENVKILYLNKGGVATSGTYERGEHIYNPREDKKAAADVLSLTVVGPDIYEADRFATAAFAMGREGIGFIEKQPGLEGYMIDKDGTAVFTSGFDQYISAP